MTITRILFVDDDEISTFLNERLLIQIDPSLNIQVISSGEEAMNYLTQGHPIDLIFLDINMPGMDGIEFISEFDFLKNNTKIVILTSVELPKFKLAKLESMNCCDVLLKPLTRTKLESVMTLKN
ncbi:MAG: response regulator [Bacteroidota bacterium]|nr:response regulator [Bacteroidota bacterium]